jgi:3,4-dihydroxy 2-butanone 4-phosphate synthase/GTP cyclohydrolase II
VHLDPIELAVTAMAEGKPVVVVDDEGRENEGDLIFPASTATAEQTAFMVRHTSGFICVGMTGADLDRLHLPPMTAVNEDRKGTAYSVTVDAKAVRHTGISAEDRAITIRVLADAASTPDDLTRPGHVIPLRAVPGGVLRRHDDGRGGLPPVLRQARTAARVDRRPHPLPPGQRDAGPAGR